MPQSAVYVAAATISAKIGLAIYVAPNVSERETKRKIASCAYGPYNFQ